MSERQVAPTQVKHRTLNPQCVELHAHLYGCIEPEDLWEWSKDLWTIRLERLEWYQQEYQALVGYKPNFKKYWDSPEGLEELTRDFTMLTPAPFTRFQAGFNLAIALFPIDPNDTGFFGNILLKEYEKGIRYGQYRIVIPAHFDDQAISNYCRSLVTTVLGSSLGDLNLDAKSYFKTSQKLRPLWHPKIVLSLSRIPHVFRRQYQVLTETFERLLEETHLPSIYALGISGIDLCGIEEGHPPKSLRSEIQRVKKQNSLNPKLALEILYHVGESFRDKSFFSAIRWVHEASEMGVDRLGHALCLGVYPGLYLDPLTPSLCRLEESGAERYDHLCWLHEWGPRLRNYGFLWSEKSILKEKRMIESLSSGELEIIKSVPEKNLPLPERIEYARSLQKAVLALIGEKGTPIEVCPTSNRLIGQIADLNHHPIQGFVHFLSSKESLPKFPLVIGSDDPGLFGSRLDHEWKLLTQHSVLPEPTLGDDLLTPQGYPCAQDFNQLVPAIATWYQKYVEKKDDINDHFV